MSFKKEKEEMNKLDLKYGKVIVSKTITRSLSWFINIKGITLYPFIICNEKPDETTLNHERIHIFQQRELFVIFFYILYVLFWVLNLFKYRNVDNFTQVAYANIPFEKEAYENEKDHVYILNRKKYRWIKYI